MKAVEVEVADPCCGAVQANAMRRLADEIELLIGMFDEGDRCIALDVKTLGYLHSPAEFSWSRWHGFVHEDDLPRLMETVTRAKTARQGYALHYRVLRSDGGERWMMDSGVPRFDEQGHFSGYVSTITDISCVQRASPPVLSVVRPPRQEDDDGIEFITQQDAEGCFIYASPSSLQMIGYERDELIGCNVYDFIHPEDVPYVRGAITQQVQTGERVSTLHLRLRHRNGGYVWIESTTSVMLDPRTGAKTGSASISRNITLEWHSREQIRLRERRYRSLLSLSLDGYWETDTQGRLTVFEGPPVWQERGVHLLLGKTREEAAFDKADPGLRSYLEKVARREPFRDIVYACELPNGGGALYLSLMGEPMYQEGAFIGYRGLTRDVTEQRRLQQQLQIVSDQNRNLVEGSLDLICLFDEHGRFLRINPAVTRTTGYTAEDLIGRYWQELLHPEDRDHTLAMYQASVEKKSAELRHLENRWLKKNGEPIHLSWRAKWIKGDRVMYATARDITEQHLAKQALEQANERLTSVLDSITDAFFSYDRDLRVIYCNRATLARIGRRLDEVIGRSVFEIEPHLRGTVFEQKYREVLLTRASAQFEAFYAPLNAWLWIRVYPSRDGGVSVFVHDITARKVAEEALARSEARFARLIETTKEGYFLADANLKFSEVNPALCRMTGFAREDLVGQPLSMLFPASPLKGAILPADRSVQTSFEVDDVVIHHRDGGIVHTLMSGTIERDETGAPVTLTGFLNDITERKLAEIRLEQLATYDPLTRLPNRTRLHEQMDAMLAAAARDDSSVAIMFIDLDHFKQVNDSMGHEAGDQLLKEVAQRLCGQLRASDFVARLGGDEFVVVLPCALGSTSASVVANKLVGALSAPIDIGGQEVFVGASIGISLYPEDGQTKEALFQNADLAMYEAKAAGRNGFRFFEEKMRDAARTRLTLESALRRALERGEFEVHYQPRLNVATLEVVGMEALLRWHHPQLGRVSPAQFIPLAEETGLIEPIGHWVLQEACRQNKAWVEKFGRPLVVSVNLSPRQLQDRLLIEKVQQALEASGLAAHLLELELTEGMLMQDPQSAAQILRELKGLGLHLAVDDFGTGYSSLVYLRRFPLDVLKLDRAFLTELSEEANQGRLAEAIIHLTHTMNLRVVAEGVETAEVFSFLKSAGCDEAQGYHLCRPVPPGEFEQFLSGRTSVPPTESPR